MARRTRKSKTPKKRVKGGANKQTLSERVAMDDPELMYVTAWPPITMGQVAKHFGVSLKAIQKKAGREGWTAKRDAFLAEVKQGAFEALKDTAKSQIVDANKRHIQLGKGGQRLAALGIREVSKRFEEDDIGEVKTGELMRASAQTAKTGVDIERKGLGLADQVMYVQGVREVATSFLIVAQQVMGGHPDLLQAFVDGVHAKLEEAEATATNVIEAQYEAEED